MNDLFATIGITEDDVARYAAVHEIGDRAFIRPTIDANMDRIADYATERARDLIDYKITPTAYFEAVGLFIADLIKESIKEKGLVDTGKMLNSVGVNVK